MTVRNSQIDIMNPILLGLGLILLWYIGAGIWGVVGAVQKLTEVLEAGLARGAG